MDVAFAVVERALSITARGSARPPYWQGLWMPELRAFRRDARFPGLAARLGFAAYWETFGPAER